MIPYECQFFDGRNVEILRRHLQNLVMDARYNPLTTTFGKPGFIGGV